MAGVVTIGGAPPAGAATGDIITFEDPLGTLSTHFPYGIAAGPDGNLWYTSYNNRIGRITPAGVITTFTDPGGTDSTYTPLGIAAGPDGNLWYTSYNNSRIGRITPAGVITTFADPGGFESTSGPQGIAAGPDGNLWYTSYDNDRIGRITPAGVITTFADPGGEASTDGPQGIAAGPDGNLWYTNVNNDRIGRIDPDDGSITTFADPEGTASTDGPQGIAAGPDGNVWYTSYDTDRIGRITPAGSITTFADPAGFASTDGPQGIAAGPDGNLWYANVNNDRIGRIDPDDGSITTFADPGGLASTYAPLGIVAGPDGNLWFTSYVNSRIGRVEVEVAPSAPTNVTATGSDGGAQVGWAAPTADGGSPVTSYRVFRDGVQVHETADGSTLAFTDAGLSNGTEYDYEVAAVNAVGEGPKSAVASATPTFSAPTTPTFSDVPVTHSFYEDIEWMAARGVSTGFQPGPTFRPAEPVTRQAMSAFMYRLAGEPAFADPATATFSDVATSSQFFTEIEWMADEGITTGFPGGLYKPGADVTRQAMSAFLYRLAGEPPFVDPPSATFSDVATSSTFLTEIEWMADEGISTGFQPGPTYRPGQAVTRQAMSAFMRRLAEGPGVDV